MEEIKVGEYIRTKQGYLGKYQISVEGFDEFIDNEGTFMLDIQNIVKHSPNIIDLIEVGDIVHTRDVLNEDYYWMFDEEMIQATKETIQDGIELVDILTHEQYQQNCYKV